MVNSAPCVRLRPRGWRVLAAAVTAAALVALLHRAARGTAALAVPVAHVAPLAAAAAPVVALAPASAPAAAVAAPQMPAEHTVTFHGIAGSAREAAQLVAAIAELSHAHRPCVLRVHFTGAQPTPVSASGPHSGKALAPLAPLLNLPAATGRRLQCRVSAVPLRAGGTWADIQLDPGTAVFVRPGAGVSDALLRWLLAAHEAVGEYLGSGGVRAFAGAAVGCADLSPVATSWAQDPSVPRVGNMCLFSPFRENGEDPWQGFVDWFRMRRGEWNIWPHIAGEFAETPRFWKSRSKHRRDPALSRVGSLVGANYVESHENWERWFARWAGNYSMRVVERRGRPSAPAPVNLGPVWRTPSGTSDIGGQTYFSVLQSIVLKGFPRVAMTIVDTAFLELTKNWLCNVQTAGFLPENVVWIALDENVRKALDEMGIGTTIDISATLTAPGAERPEILYGHPTYWKLMLLRTRLIRDLLLRGVDVFLFETDQTWLQDPFEYIGREIAAGADMVGTLDTQHNVAGNTLLLRSVLPTRRMWGEVYSRFKASYDSNEAATRPESEFFFVEHDQHSLSDLVLYNERFMHEYPVALGLMNADLFVGGSWYSGEYSSEASKRPVIINNNFVSGVGKKKKRAQAFGHWFLDKDGVCMPDSVRRALRYPDDSTDVGKR